MRSTRAAAIVALALLLPLLGCDTAEVSRAVGARCDVKAECDERCQPHSEEFPGGFCTYSCLSDRDCPGATRCVELAGGICLFQCEETEDCAFLGDLWGCFDEAAFPSRDDGDEVSICLGSDG